MFISKEEKIALQSRSQTQDLRLHIAEAELRSFKERLSALEQQVAHQYGTKKDGTPKARPGGPKKVAASPLHAIGQAMAVGESRP